MTTTESPTPRTAPSPARPPRPPARCRRSTTARRSRTTSTWPSDRKLQRALEAWQPKFLDWWKNLGPSIPTHDVYLRTAIAVGRDGWAHFDRVPMEDYRWGIFLAEADPDRKVNFGDQQGRAGLAGGAR